MLFAKHFDGAFLDQKQPNRYITDSEISTLLRLAIIPFLVAIGEYYEVYRL